MYLFPCPGKNTQKFSISTIAEVQFLGILPAKSKPISTSIRTRPEKTIRTKSRIFRAIDKIEVRK